MSNFIKGDLVKVRYPRFEKMVGEVYGVDADGDVDVMFQGWEDGHSGGADDGSRNHWWVDPRYVWLADTKANPTDMRLPVDSKARKEIPLKGGLLDYFPDALVAVARISKKGNDKHNPGQPLHWSRDKSTDHLECILRHLIDYDKLDEDGELHIDHLIWRALAQSQLMKEAAGAPKAPGAK